MRRVVRNLASAAIGLTCVSLHQARPDWGYIPLTVCLVLLAINYGVWLWLYVRRGTE